MPRGVYQVEYIFFATLFIFHLDCVALDRDSTFALQVHVIKYLVLKIPVCQGMGELYETVSQCAFTVINVGYDAKIPDVLHPVSYTHLRAHETDSYLVCRLLLEKK